MDTSVINMPLHLFFKRECALARASSNAKVVVVVVVVVGGERIVRKSCFNSSIVVDCCQQTFLNKLWSTRTNFGPFSEVNVELLSHWRIRE